MPSIMAKAQPHHLVSGLYGGYMPGIVEHYDTKAQATESLREFKDRVLWDEEVVSGSIKDGYLEFQWSEVVQGFHSYALIEPCTCEGESEREEADEWEMVS